MRVFLFILLLLTLYTVSNGQIIKGTVVDQDTHDPINFASVYIGGTIIGTYTDKNGKFELDITDYRSMPVTVSALGYYSVNLTNTSWNDTILVLLAAKTFELSEVVISADISAIRKERERNLRVFKNEFLGTTAAALNCEIANEADISFLNSSDKDTLKAFSNKPLLIENNALGYSVIYYLDKFEYCKSDKFLLLRGNYHFEEDTTLDQKSKAKFEKERRRAYSGSRMHFIRALWNNDLKGSGFIIRNSVGQELSYDSLIVMSDSIVNGFPIKYLKYHEDLQVIHYPAMSVSKVKMEKEDVLISRLGYFDPLAIKWEGEMSRLRIADMLPFDYLEDEYFKRDQSIYDSLNIIEKGYLHTDRSYYYSGDDIWFKAYLIDAADRSLTDNSGNLHVELISPLAKIIDSRIIRLENGLGNGDFELSEEVQTGTYQIRAYTNYMRNWDERLIFCKSITIINPSDSAVNLPHNEKPFKNTINIGFFPEGGSLIDNVSSSVAFKAVDAHGVGCDVDGELFSSDGKYVTRFKTSKFGMGSFSLKPAPGLDYFAVITNKDGDTLKIKFPDSFATGIAMSIAQNQGKEFIVTVKTNTATGPQVFQSDLMLIISSRGTIIRSFGFRINALTNALIIPSDDLPEGILMFTITSIDQIPLCERLFYLQRNEKIRFSVESDKRNYEKRDSVSLKISLTDESGTPQVAFMSLSASEKVIDVHNPQDATTISSWFLLESDVHGPVEAPSYYFDQSNGDRIRDLNLLLMTQGWRDFKWKNNKAYYLPENGFSISGKLSKLFGDKPIENSDVNILIIGGENTISTAVPTGSSGKFHLDGIIFTGEARLIASGKDNKGEPRGWIALDSLQYFPANSDYSVKPFISIPEETVSKMTHKQEIVSNIKRSYTLTDTISLNEIVIVAESKEANDPQTVKVKRDRAVYGVPDVEVIITPQLEGLSNILEALRGRVPGVIVTGNYPNIKVFIRGFGSVNAGTQPLFLLDGSVVAMEDILSLPVSFVDRIDILKGGITATLGLRGGNGVISLITRTGDRLVAYQPVNHSANIKIHGYDEARIFYSPQHLKSTEPDYKPDYRTTLFWKPDIVIEAENEQSFKYFNADNSATIQVIVEGITATGIPLTAKTEYEVR